MQSVQTTPSRVSILLYNRLPLRERRLAVIFGVIVGSPRSAHLFAMRYSPLAQCTTAHGVCESRQENSHLALDKYHQHRY